MSRVEIDTPAPDFSPEDFRGQTVQLADYRGQKHDEELLTLLDGLNQETPR